MAGCGYFIYKDTLYVFPSRCKMIAWAVFWIIWGVMLCTAFPNAWRAHDWMAVVSLALLCGGLIATGIVDLIRLVVGSPLLVVDADGVRRGSKTVPWSQVGVIEFVVVTPAYRRRL